MKNAVVWFEIYVQDIPRARSFYEGVFAVELEEIPTPDESEMLAFPMNPDGTGASGAIVKMPESPSGGNSTLVYFGCEDCAIEEGRVAASGGTVVREKFDIGEYGFISLVTDTEGNMIGLHSEK